MRAAYIAAAQEEAASEHRFQPDAGGGFVGKSAAQGLRAAFRERGVEVTGEDASWRWEPTAARFGCEGALGAVEAVLLEATDNRAYRRRGFDEWYVAGPLGIEQGFTLNAAPACRAEGHEKVVIELAGGGQLAAEVTADGTGATLHNGTGNEVLRYTDLYVVDAAGKELPAELRAEGERVTLAFDDRGARYPVTVDPLVWVQQQKLLASDGQQ